jgi:hypothetical protein
MGSALEAIKKKGYFKAYKESNKAYLEQCKLVRQVKAHLAKLDGTSSKKPKETTAVASPADLALKAE